MTIVTTNYGARIMAKTITRIAIRVADPKTKEDKDFYVEARISPSTDNPKQAYAVIGGKEYLIEVY